DVNDPTVERNSALPRCICFLDGVEPCLESGLGAVIDIPRLGHGLLRQRANAVRNSGFQRRRFELGDGLAIGFTRRFGGSLWVEIVHRCYLAMPLGTVEKEFGGPRLETLIPRFIVRCNINCCSAQ